VERGSRGTAEDRISVTPERQKPQPLPPPPVRPKKP